MDPSIAAILAQDGVTNGSIYALLALALVLVFAVTRIIFVPSGEFVAWGTLTLAGLQLGRIPGTVGVLIGMAVTAGILEAVDGRLVDLLRGLEVGVHLGLGLREDELADHADAHDGRHQRGDKDGEREVADQPALDGGSAEPSAQACPPARIGSLSGGRGLEVSAHRH
jgi:hypothetical protein